MGMLRAATTGDGTAPLVNADVLDLPLPDSALDGATCGFALRNLTAVPPLFAELARALRSGGRIGLLEVDSPTNPVLRWGHGLYFGRVVPLIGGLLSDRDAYRYLPESVAYLPAYGGTARRAAVRRLRRRAPSQAQRRHRPTDHRHPRLTQPLVFPN